MASRYKIFQPIIEDLEILNRHFKSIQFAPHIELLRFICVDVLLQWTRRALLTSVRLWNNKRGWYCCTHITCVGDLDMILWIGVHIVYQYHQYTIFQIESHISTRYFKFPNQWDIIWAPENLTRHENTAFVQINKRESDSKINLNLFPFWNWPRWTFLHFSQNFFQFPSFYSHFVSYLLKS